MRLIDADELIREGWRLERHGQSNELIGIKSIADVPTAYDVGKVVEQLEILSDIADDDMAVELNHPQYYDGLGDGFTKAIEIVRNGGAEE